MMMGFKQFYLSESDQKLIGYHSTNSKFEAFDHKFTGYVGFYFTPEKYFEHPEHKNSTLDYSKGKKYTLKCELTLKNPIPNDVFVDVMNKAYGGNPRKMAIEQFKKLGYDGYIATAQIWVFEPEQIRILNVVDNEINEMASLNTISDEDDNDEMFTDILTNNHVGYSDPKEKFNYDGILWARYDKIFVGFANNKIHPSNAMILVVTNFKNKFNFPQVYGIETKEKYRNKGLATKIHEYFIKKYGGVITDDSLSYSETNGGIYFVYKKLSQKYPTYVISPNFKIIKSISKFPEPKDLFDMDDMNCFLFSKDKLSVKDVTDWNSINESITPIKPKKVLTKYKMKNSGLWSAHKLRYKEFTTPLGNKIFVHFKDYGGNNNCEINFETNESFDDKDLNDPDILKNVLFVVLKEVNNKKYKNIEIRPIHRTSKDSNKHVRFEIFKRSIEKYFIDYDIILADKSKYGDKDTILLERKKL